jgi:uncharacterized protein YqgV (UPF0045/DUF77 family)
MCTLDEVTSCQISFIPIQSESYIADINIVLDLIIASGLEYSIGEMSTVIKSSKLEVLNLISNIYDLMSNKCSFVMDIRLSNTCGCKGGNL